MCLNLRCKLAIKHCKTVFLSAETNGVVTDGALK